MGNWRATVFGGEGESEQESGAPGRPGRCSVDFTGSCADIARFVASRGDQVVLLSKDLLRSMGEGFVAELRGLMPAVETLVLSSGEDDDSRRPGRVEQSLALPGGDLERMISGGLPTWASRLALKGMIDGLTQRICEPVAAVRQAASQALADLEQEDAVRRQLERIMTASQSVLVHVYRLLEFARPFSEPFQSVSVVEAIYDARRAVRGMCEKEGIGVSTTIPDKLPSVLAQRKAFAQVCTELMRNAVEAMPGGGALRIDVAHRARDAEIIVRIEDTGGGFAGLEWDLACEAFVTTKDGHVGLGLPIVLSFLRRHDGALELDAAEDGSGTAVTLRLSC